MKLINYVTDAAARVKATRSLDLFLELRYRDLAHHFPHDVFSVGQASLDFFERAAEHLNGKPFFTPKHPGEKEESPSVYEMNYRRWIISHK